MMIQINLKNDDDETLEITSDDITDKAGNPQVCLKIIASDPAEDYHYIFLNINELKEAISKL